jgi:hypothetical protein
MDETWNIERKVPLENRSTEDGRKGVGKYKLNLVGQLVRWEKGGTEQAENYTFFHGERREDHHLVRGFF